LAIKTVNLMAERSNKKPGIAPEGQEKNGPILTREYALPGWESFAIRAGIIISVVFWIYWPAAHGNWLWDDSMYLSDNSLLKEPARLWKAWFAPGSFIEYYPLEETLQWIQWKFWGNDTFPYHLTNIVLHVLNAFLVWRLLSKLGLRLAWLGGLVFAVHPMMVESVAWISEFKNTLSLFPFLLAMCAWIDYEASGRSKDYFRSLALFLVSMLCKIGVAPFPAIILLYAWWKRGRIGWRDWKACVPFAVISVSLAWLSALSGTWYMQGLLKEMAVVENGGLLSRFALAGQTLSLYFTRCFWPVGPMPIYPQWKVDPSAPLQFLPWIAIVVAFFWLWRRRQSWGRHVLLALGFFVLLLAPFLGFVSVSYLSFSWVMDHFLYVPIIGIIAIVVAGIGNIDDRLPRSLHPLLTGLLTVMVALLAFESHWYASAFTGDETFWTYALDRNPDAWLAHNNLGKILLVEEGEPELAKAHFEKVIRLRPDLAEGYCNLGNALVQLGRTSESIEAFNESLKRDPYSPETNNNLGILAAQRGDTAAAISYFSTALYRHPHFAEALNNLGNALLEVGRTDEAIQQFQLAIDANPTYLAAHENMGLALEQEGHLVEAGAEFEHALQINPDDNKAEQGLMRVEHAPASKPLPPR
jgi:Flp pilus assembly protein TadD